MVYVKKIKKKKKKKKKGIGPKKTMKLHRHIL